MYYVYFYMTCIIELDEFIFGRWKKPSGKSDLKITKTRTLTPHRIRFDCVYRKDAEEILSHNEVEVIA